MICGMMLLELRVGFASEPCTVEIEADRIEGREYIGNVVLKACSGRITAPRVKKVERAGVVLRFEFEGGVSYSQPAESGPIKGSSDAAVYRVGNNRLQLFGKPNLSQGAVEQYGDPIVHYVTRQSLVPAGLDDRLRIVPDTNNEQRQ